MFFIYNIATILLVIAFSPIILIAFIIQPKFRAGFKQKMGFLNDLNAELAQKPTLFFHAVSVGEVNAIENLIKKTREEFKNHNIVISTVTKTGQEVARSKLKDFVDEIVYFPYDFTFSTRAFLDKIKPEKIIIAETEIWPCFINEAHKRNIPVFIVNGRISPKSHKGYRKISFFLKKILKKYTLILVQTKDDAIRMIDIGANHNIVKVMGNLKFDVEKTLDQYSIDRLSNEIELNLHRMVIAASTHKGEDEIILRTFCELKKEFADIKLLIAPRHPQRYAKVESLIDKTGLKYGKRSFNGNFKDNEIVMLDTMGELSKFFALCHFAFIGGSFSKTGGHNPLEATIWDKPVVSGENVFNFKDIYNLLSQSCAAIMVDSEKELAHIMHKFLSDEKFYQQAVWDCKSIFEANKGAVDYVIKVLKY